MKTTLIALLLALPLLAQAQNEVWIMTPPNNTGHQTLILPDGRFRTIITPRAYSFQPYGSDYRGYGSYQPVNPVDSFMDGFNRGRAFRRSWGMDQ